MSTRTAYGDVWCYMAEKETMSVKVDAGHGS